MAISLHTAGSWVAANATTQTVTLPTHSTGDMLLVRVAFKHATMPTTVTCGTAGWAKVGTEKNSAGGASGNGSGGVEVAVFWKQAASGAETNPVITFDAGTAATPSGAVANSYSKGAGETWSTPVGDGAAFTATTSISQAVGSHIVTGAGDLVEILIGVNDNTTLTVPTCTQTGVTFAAVVESPAAALSSTTSNDIAADGAYRIASSGTSSAAAVVTGTDSASQEGCVWTTRLRAYTSAPISVSPGAAALSVAGVAPTVAISQNAVSLPTAAALSIAGVAPTVTAVGTFSGQPTAAALSVAGVAPTVTAIGSANSQPTAAALSATMATPTVVAVGTFLGLPTSGQVGDLRLEAHRTPATDGESPLIGARSPSGDLGYDLYIKKDDGNAFGYGVNHVVLVLNRADNGNEASLILMTADLGLVTWMTEWQLRLDIWGDPTALTVRGRAYHTGDAAPAWTTTSDNYALIPRSDDALAQDATLDATSRIGLRLASAAPALAFPIQVSPTAATVSATMATPSVVAIGTFAATPTAAAGLTLTTGTPTVATPVLVQPTAAALTLATATPAVVAVGTALSQPTAISLALTTGTPFVEAIGTALSQPTAAALTLTTATPDVVVPFIAEPTATALSLATGTPTVDAIGTAESLPTAATLTITTGTPSVTIGTTDYFEVTPPAAALTLTTATPAVTAVGTANSQPTAASLALATATPTVSAIASALSQPTAASLSLATATPTVTAVGTADVQPTAASLSIHKGTPTVIAVGTASSQPTAAALSLGTQVPTVTVTTNTYVAPTPASLHMTAMAPAVVVTDHRFVYPTPRTLTLTTGTPIVVAGRAIVDPLPASLSLTTATPDVVAIGTALVLPTGAILLLSTATPVIANGKPLPTHVAASIATPLAPSVTVTPTGIYASLTRQGTITARVRGAAESTVSVED